MKKKILVTGVAGFIGSNIAKKLIKEGYHVIGIDDLSSGNLSSVPKQVDFIKHDLSKKKKSKITPQEMRNNYAFSWSILRRNKF